MIRIAALGAAALVAATPSHPTPSPLHACTVQRLAARCGTVVVPENRGKPHGRTIGLHVVVLPAYFKPAKDAVAYLTGGPGGAATTEASSLSGQWTQLRQSHDILLVDQRGTGKSNAFSCPPTTSPPQTRAQIKAYSAACLRAFRGDARQYGTRMAADDLEAVRAALGYDRLDVVGGSYGATAAQVFMQLHSSSVRTLTLMGATALDVPFFGRFAANAQRALDQWARACSADPACRRAFPGWEQQFGRLVKAWDAKPVQVRKGVRMSGVQLASVVHKLLLDGSKAPSIPLLVARAAAGDYRPLVQAGEGDLGASPQIMYWSIWCNEPWAGLDAKGPWGTEFDSYTAAFIGMLRRGCTFMPKRSEPAALWSFPASKRVPLLVIAGGADPQDPPTNLPKLKRNFADSRAAVLPHIGHSFGLGGCIDEIISTFVARGTTKGLVTDRCDSYIPTPTFPVTG